MRRFSAWLHPRRRLQVGFLLAGPLGWLTIAYFGSLFILLLSAFWAKDAFTGKVEPFNWSLDALGDMVAGESVESVACTDCSATTP